MIGPSLPPHLAQKTQEDEESDDDYGPALPPHLLAKRTSNVVTTEQTLDSDSEDEIGPQLPAAIPNKQQDEVDGVQEFLERERRRKALEEEEKKPKPLKREEWMLAPPSSSDLLRSIDPTKIKSRQFSKATGRDEVSKDMSLWTETPAERQARLADELSGKRKRPTAGPTDEEEEINRKRRKHDNDLKRQIAEHNKSIRPTTLLEMHQEALSQQPTESENAAIWDRDRDMGSGGKLMDQSTRSKLIKDAKSLGDRFGSGKRGGYGE